ncbi:uncharacterized protein KY384_004791 [Bacidia gigantensis]|uniref:uncharacterized protein n=1 Tax=Bacidia gigantensis TaxID=2732470 RepID=UPI001D03FB8E|nr:uncharacterized protein KY384_004791 [Bacidia gigantensis]KAG8530289.1 hypothetical protein KY384_004791 [Bacidia gigantensis]
MLAEHCQKVKWHKPEYTMSHNAADFSSMVILKSTNPKTRETVTLPPFKLPPDSKHLALQPSAVEARHFAATYALFRVSSMKNIHMMLPPTYRDLWKKEFHELKSADLKDGKGWMYEADPFAAKLEREEAQAATAKKRDEREKKRAKEADNPIVSLAPGSSTTGSSKGNLMKGWTKAPKVEMGKRTRADMETTVRKGVVWNPLDIRMSKQQRDNVIDELSKLGFRRSHAEEAVEECKDREETLEWLLIHVPEDDLPKWALPEGYSAGLSIASSDMKKEAAIKRLAEGGYSGEMCAVSLTKCQGDENMAAEVLQSSLVYQEQADGAEVPNIADITLNDDARDNVWHEEIATLEAIYGSRFQYILQAYVEIQMEFVSQDMHAKLRVRPAAHYPQRAPVLAIVAHGMPSYIRLSITRQVLEYANSNLLGEPMIFGICDWLEAEIPNIVENPGKLKSVSAAISGSTEITSTDKRQTQTRVRHAPRPIDWRPRDPRSSEMLQRLQLRQATPQQQKMLAVRRSLPAWKKREAIVSTVNTHQVTIIAGETGSGKSTQSVQFILDEMISRHLGSAANLICTQPRRISALGLADRVSAERCSSVGDEVGYAIRGEAKQSKNTKVTFVTTGVLLRRLQTSGGSKEDLVAALADVSHVVVDEVHERSLDTDFLLVLLKDILARRSDLKLVLMSATLDASIFSEYFDGEVGLVEIEGRTYPVEDNYLDDIVSFTGFTPAKGGNRGDDPIQDANASVPKTIQSLGMGINYDLIKSLVETIDLDLGSVVEGGVLIFLPGTFEINRTLQVLQSLHQIHALPLHASLTPAEQRRVFPPAPKGKRKVIAATNVAETSITIEDIVAVIDTGKVKETSFDPQNNMVKLQEVWASRAACKQRRGRAGRVREGQCYKLYTKNAEAKMAERPEPEIRRVPLEQLCLSVRGMGIVDVPSFLASALTPPETTAVEGAMVLLARMGALDGDQLTALGRHISLIPADLRCGKLIVYGSTFGCLDSCLTIAAILSSRSPFLSPQDKREESKAARTAFAPGQGDLVCDLRAHEEWNTLKSTSSYRDTRAFCDTHFLSQQTLTDISSTRSQLLSSLSETGLLPSRSPPSAQGRGGDQNTNIPLVRALIAASFTPSIATISFPDKKYAPSVSGAVELDPEARTIKYFTQFTSNGPITPTPTPNPSPVPSPINDRIFIHPSSTLFTTPSFPSSTHYLTYFSKLHTNKPYIRDITPFNVFTLLLFCGKLELDPLGRGVLVDGWIRVRGWARLVALVGRVRGMLDEVLGRRFEGLAGDMGRDEEVVGVVRRLVEFDGLDA